MPPPTMRLFHVAVLALAFLLAELVRAKTILENGVAQNEAEPVDTAQGAPLPFPEGAQRSQVYFEIQVQPMILSEEMAFLDMILKFSSVSGEDVDSSNLPSCTVWLVTEGHSLHPDLAERKYLGALDHKIDICNVQHYNVGLRGLKDGHYIARIEEHPQDATSPRGSTPIAVHAVTEFYLLRSETPRLEAMMPDGMQQRGHFPQKQPEVSVALLSCKRMFLLQWTLMAAISHLEVKEDVAYEVVWVDNGTPAGDVAAVADLFEIEKKVLLGGNYGAAYGWNMLLRTSDAPFVLMLEEDWALRTDLPASMLRAAIDVLATDHRLLLVYFRWVMDQTELVGPWRRTASGAQYRLHCANGYGWGGFTAGASLVHKERFLSIGYYNDSIVNNFDSELDFMSRANQRFCSAELRVADECTSTHCNYLAHHLGHLRRSPGFVDFGLSDEADKFKDPV